MVAAEPHGTRNRTKSTSEEIADDTHTRRRSAQRGETLRGGRRQDRFPRRSGTHPRDTAGNVDVDGIEVPQGDGHTIMNLVETTVPGTQDCEGLATLGHHGDR